MEKMSCDTLDEKATSSASKDALQFYKTAVEVGLNPGDAGGAQADFFERFLRKHSENIKEDTITSVKRGYIFTRRLHCSRKSKKRKPHNLLTSREKRTLGLFTVTQHGQLSYKSFLRIHDLWKGYFKEAVASEKVSKLENLQISLMKADYTGCHFVVAAGKCTTHVGQKGLVVQETKNTFKILAKDDRIVSIPKKGTLFAFMHEDKLYKIYGSHFRKHGFERAKSKFKVTENVNL